MDCVICLDKEQISGIKCTTCRSSVCLVCETNLTKCPFCRSNFPKWFERVLESPNTLEHRLNQEITTIYKESLRFRTNREFLMERINSVILGKSSVQDFLSLFTEHTTDEQKVDWLIAAKDFLHQTVMHSFPEEVSQLIIVVVDWLHNSIENISALERFGVFQEEIDEWEQILYETECQKYFQCIKQISKIENDFRTRAVQRKHIRRNMRRRNASRLNRIK